MYEDDLEVPQFEPWSKYSDLTKERLSIVADIIRRVRHEAVLSSEPGKGETNWSLGCRAYERTCYAFRTEAPKHSEWFSICQETRPLQFSFAIGSITFKFYSGSPDDPPNRYAISSFGELHHQQMCLQLEGFRPPDNVLRIAVETSPMTQEVTVMSVVEVDTAGNPIASYVIPHRQRSTPVVSVTQTKPVELAPPAIQPLAKAGEDEGQDVRGKTKAAATDSGSK